MRTMLRGVTAGLLLALATGLLTPAPAQTRREPPAKPPEVTPEDKELEAKARKLDAEAAELYQAGKPRAAAEKLAESLAVRQKLYAPERFPDGHPQLAASLSK